MLQKVAEYNVRVPKSKVLKTYMSHNVQSRKTYTVTKCKVDIKKRYQMLCDAVRFVMLYLM
jgi:hypothetical protein